MGNSNKQLTWSVTPWQMSPEGGWKTQPIILVEGQKPFYADAPDKYIEKLQSLHLNPRLRQGNFHTLIGQFKDALEQYWRVPVAAGRKGPT